MSQKTIKTPQEIADQYVKTTTVKTLDGSKEYTYKLLKRRVAAEVHYKTLSIIIKSVFGILGSRGEALSGLSIAKVVDILEFDVLWDLGGKLLTGVQIGGVQVDFEDYYGENPDELIFAIVYGIKTNYPRVFTKVRARLHAIDLPGRLKKMAADNPKLDTGSLQELLKTFQSQDSTG